MTTPTIEHYKALDKLILQKTNVKKLTRIINTEPEILLTFDGENYSFWSEGEDVTTPKLLEVLHETLKSIYSL